jgi:transcription termination factor NusB
MACAQKKARELALRMLYQAETNMDEPENSLKCTVRPSLPQDVIEYAELLLSGIKRERNVKMAS